MKVRRQYLRSLIQEVQDENVLAAGDCYEAAGKYMMDNCMFGGCDLVLVHGEVMGQGRLEGMTYGHAWILNGNTVIDKSNGGNLHLPRQVYYSIGQIDNIGNTHTYTWEEARRKIMDLGHWGPWDLKTKSGL